MDELAVVFGPFAAALFLAVANSKIIDYVFRPIRKKFPEVDFWFIIYVALLTGGLIGWISELNLYAPYIPNEVVGRVLTAITIGGGSSLVHEIFGDSGK